MHFREIMVNIKKVRKNSFFRNSQSQYITASKIGNPLSHVSHRIPSSLIFFIFGFYVIIFRIITVS